MTFTKEQRRTVEAGGNVVLTIDGIPCVVVREEVFEKMRLDGEGSLSTGEMRELAGRTFEDADTATRIEP